MLNHIKDHGTTPMIALVSQDCPLAEIDQKSDSFGLAWGISRVFPAVSPQTDLSFDDCGEANQLWRKKCEQHGQGHTADSG